MLQNESRLLVADNSGAKELLVIRCLGGSNRKFSGIGDLVVATVKKAIPWANVGKGKIVTALIVNTRKGFRRKDGTWIKFSENYAVIVKVGDRPYLGTRIFVPILREFDEWGHKKILSLAPEVV
ncbi:MAG: 50S ribosomal protein L14 [Mycoplasmataceae bacterium]|nr:MAG: 50S ribosomal protein L14 [Mycoplasmataceae bacterium]